MPYMYNNTDNRHPVPPSSLLSPGRESLLGSYYFPFPSLFPSLAFLDRHSIPTSPTRHNPSAQATDENDVCPYPHQPSLWGGSIWLPRSNETRHTLCAHPWTSLTSLRSRNDAPHHSIGFPPPDEPASPPSILGRSAHSLASLARPHTGSFTEIAIGYPQTRFSRDPTACQPPALPARYDGPIISFSFFLPPLRTFPRVCRLSVAASLVVAPSRVIVWSKLPLGLAEPGLKPTSRGPDWTGGTTRTYATPRGARNGGDDLSISLCSPSHKESHGKIILQHDVRWCCRGNIPRSSLASSVSPGRVRMSDGRDGFDQALKYGLHVSVSPRSSFPSCSTLGVP